MAQIVQAIPIYLDRNHVVPSLLAVRRPSGQLLAGQPAHQVPVLVLLPQDDKGLPRDGKLARIIWLLMFEAYEFPYSSVGVLRSARPSVSDTVYTSPPLRSGQNQAAHWPTRPPAKTAMLGR